MTGILIKRRIGGPDGLPERVPSEVRDGGPPAKDHTARQQTQKQEGCLEQLLPIAQKEPRSWTSRLQIVWEHAQGRLASSGALAMATHSSTLAWKIPWMEEPW